MHNSDMPAMPQPMVMDADGDTYTTFDNYHGDQAGLTKREMFAKDADVKAVMERLNNDAIQGLAGWEVNWGCYIDIAKAYFAVESKLKIIKADALLAELEK